MTESDFGQREIKKQKNLYLKVVKNSWVRDHSSPLIRKNKFAPNYYLQSQAMRKIELVLGRSFMGVRAV